MAQDEQPITRSELREELRRYPTREELREELSTYTTREELRDELRHYATKADLAQMETRLTRWMIGMMLGSIVAASSASLVIQRILG